MFKTGVKRIFLVLSLLFSVGFVFTACDKEKVAVTSISFVEQDVIKLVVGHEYSPEISVLPSYADETGYYFEVVSSTNSLEIQKTKIIARSAGTAQLKVVSKDNENINDVISVKVLPKAVQLDSPSGLMFDGETFSFSSVKDALSYTISVNGQEFNLGNTTYFNLSQYETLTSSSQTGKILTVNVKSVGDEIVSLSSSYDIENEIKVLKIEEVKNPKFNNNILEFDKVAGVKNYKLTFAKGNSDVLNLTIKESDYSGDKIRFDLTSYLPNFDGGDYVCNIVADKTGYSADGGVDVSSSKITKLAFELLSKPQNVRISNYELTWNKVSGADFYTIYNNSNVIATNIENNYYDLKNIELSQFNNIKVVANARITDNVVSGVNFSDEIRFEKLSSPNSTNPDDGIIYWDKVDNAKGYRVEIYNNEGDLVVDKNLTGLVDLDKYSYDASELETGEYEYKIFALGNGVDSLNSLECVTGQFSVLERVSNLKIENRIISWDSENDMFDVSIYKVDGDSETLFSQSLGITEKKYSLVGVILDSGDYKVYVNSVGENNVFNSRKKELSFHKLLSIQNSLIEDNVLTFDVDTKTQSSKVTFTKNGENLSLELQSVDLTTYNMLAKDGQPIESGKYSLNIYIYGNGTDILDDGETSCESLNFTKLEAPTFALNDTQISLVSLVDDALEYQLMQNGKEFARTNSTIDKFEIGNVNYGEYVYTFKSIGNGGNILDSEINSSEIKVLKLNTPTINFNLKDSTSGQVVTDDYSISIETDQAEYVSDFVLKINNETQTVTSLSADKSIATYGCSSKFLSSGNYTITAELIASSSDDYDLILSSNVKTELVEKLNANSSLTLKDGKLYIKPDESLLDKDVNFSFKVKFNTSVNEKTSATSNEAVFEDGNYVVNIIDEFYNDNGYKISEGYVFDLDTLLTVTVIYESNDSKVVDSEFTFANSLTRLEKVGNISKTSETLTNIEKEYITFDSVTGATGYKLEIIENSKYYYIDVSSSKVLIDDVISLFKEQGLEILENTIYSLKVVALGSDGNYIISSKSNEVFELIILNSPSLTITNFGSTKQLSIENSIAKAGYYEITFTDSEENVKKVSTSKSSEAYTVVDLPEMVAGKIYVEVKALSKEYVVFKSGASSISYTQLENPALTMENGLLSWNVIDNASSYQLSYNYNGTETKLELNAGDYVINDNQASYDFGSVTKGITILKIKAISILNDGEDNYNNSLYSESFSIYKLSQPTFEIYNGNIKLTVPREEIAYISKIEIVSGVNRYDILTFVEEISSSMIIDPAMLLEYVGVDEILEESFDVFVYAKDYKEGDNYICLNSNKYTFSCKGLKTVDDVKILTSINYDLGLADSLDKISWTNNILNNGNLRGFEIVVYYQEQDYNYTCTDINTDFYLFPVEEDFGSGEYIIKVRVLADGEYLNSKFTEEHKIIVCGETEELATSEGKIVWKQVDYAEKYIVRIYESVENDGELSMGDVIVTAVTSNTQFDFVNLSSDLGADLYYVTVQAINETNSTISSSAESQALQVVRLPEVDSYYINKGELIVYHHKYVSQIQLIIIAEGITKPITVNVSSQIAELTEGYTDWDSYTNLKSDLADENTEEIKVGTTIHFSDEVVSLIDAIAGEYSIQIIALGNSSNNFATVNSKITNSGNIGELTNTNVTTSSIVKKLPSPSARLVGRGIVEWSYSDTEYPPLNYDGLEGLLIYNVQIDGNSNYNFYCVDNIDLDNLPSALTIDNIHVYTETENHTYYGYINYNNMYINILRYTKDGVSHGALELDFTAQVFYYIDFFGTLKWINLVEGGNFDVSVNVVGDNTIYINSNFSQSVNLERYDQLTISISDGYLTFVNSVGNSDKAIYLLDITNVETKENVYVYLYNEGFEIDLETVPYIKENATYKHATDFTKESILYMFDTIYNDNYLFSEGIYQIKLKVVPLKSEDLSVLESKETTSFQATKLDESELSISNGKLCFNQLSVYGVSNKIVYDYEITAINGEEKIVFRISQGSYTVTSNKIYYELPEQIIDVNEETKTFDSSVVYTFTVKGLAHSYVDYINSNDSNKLEVEMTPQVANVRLENNTILWDDEEYGSYQVLITFTTDEGEVVKIVTSATTNKFYELTAETMKDVNDEGRNLLSSYSYNISVRKIGSNSMLSSFYTTPIVKEKLAKVNTKLKTMANPTGIYFEDGVLNWSPLTNLAGEVISDVEYEIDFVNIDKDNIVTTSTSYDFEGMYGEIVFTINARHFSYFESKQTSEITIYKYPKLDVGEIEIGENYDSLTWNAVSLLGRFAEKYIIEVITVDGTSLFEEEYKGENLIVFDVKDVELSGATIRVKVVNTDTSSFYISSDWSAEISFTKAEAINKDYFEIEDYKIKFVGTESAEEGDKYILTYKWTSPDEMTSETVSVTINYSDYVVEDGNKVYYYQLTRVGKYQDITVTVNRYNQDLSSSPVVMTTADEYGYEYATEFIFDLFYAGDGDQNPYQISTVEHLLNINKFLSSNYVLINNIEFTDDIGTIVSGVFSGTFDGGGYNLENFALTSAENYSAIFSKANGATISNLTINKARVNINHSYDGSSKLYGGVLFAYAENITVNNVTITNSLLNVSIVDNSSVDNSTNSRFYYGAIAGYIANSTLKALTINLTDKEINVQIYNQISVTGYNRDNVYFGGVAGYALDTNIGDIDNLSSVTVYYKTTITRNSETYPILYFGAVVGAVNSADQNSEPNNYITNVNVTVYQSDESSGEVIYNGGAVGYLYLGGIKSVGITGNIGANVSKIVSYQIYLGKIVAKLNSNMVNLEGNIDNGIILSAGDSVTTNDTINQ